MKKIGLSDILNVEEVVAAIKMYRDARPGTFSEKCAEEIITPVLERINKKLGQAYHPLYLAYCVEYVFMQTRVKERMKQETPKEYIWSRN